MDPPKKKLRSNTCGWMDYTRFSFSLTLSPLPRNVKGNGIDQAWRDQFTHNFNSDSFAWHCSIPIPIPIIHLYSHYCLAAIAPKCRVCGWCMSSLITGQASMVDTRTSTAGTQQWPVSYWTFWIKEYIWNIWAGQQNCSVFGTSCGGSIGRLVDGWLVNDFLLLLWRFRMNVCGGGGGWWGIYSNATMYGRRHHRNHHDHHQAAFIRFNRSPSSSSSYLFVWLIVVVALPLLRVRDYWTLQQSLLHSLCLLRFGSLCFRI